MFSRELLVVIVLVLGSHAPRLSVADEKPSLDRYVGVEYHMGAKFTITLYADDEDGARRAIAAGFRRVAELNDKLSDYDAESELNRLCRSAPHEEWQPISTDLAHVLRASLEMHKQSAGAFDVTVGPLTRLWRRAKRLKRLPEQDRLRQALGSVGSKFVRLDTKNRRLRLLAERMQLDLGGIAKGFAADEALRAMREKGLARGLVNAGGDIVAGEPPPAKKGWRIGIAPLDPRGKPSQFVTLANQAVATSGDAWQFIPIDGKRYSHIVNPRTGLGLTRRSSVTVIAPSGMAADAWASAISVMGTAGLKKLDDLPGHDGVLVWTEEKAVKTARSKHFPKEPPAERPSAPSN